MKKYKITLNKRVFVSLRHLLFAAFLVFYFQAFSQSPSASVKKTLDSLVSHSPQGYTDIHSVLRRYRNDTIVMRYVAQMALENDYIDGQLYALNELGRKYRNTNQYKKAINLHEQALKIATETDNLEFRVSSLNNLGVVYRRTSSIRAAMDYNQKALELAEAVENPSISLKRSINISHNCIGNLYQELRQYDKAIVQFEKSLLLEAELNNLLGQAINYQNVGECKEELNNLDEALKDYQTSLDLNNTINNDMGRVICYNSIAQIYVKKNQPTKALTYLNIALEKARKLDDDFLIAPVFINFGWAKLLLKDYQEAEKNMLTGLRLSEASNLPYSTTQASRLLSALYKEKGDFEKALQYNVKAEKLEEEILNVNTIRYVNDIIYRYDSQKQSTKIEVLAKENENVTLALRKNRTILLIAGLALALLAGIFYILYRQYQLKNEKKVLTLEQSMLRSQMNPHFLFNSLNSIKLYIINNEQKNAVHYLNKFSKLVRKILEASSLREIPLAEELETAELYMNIENIRFSNEIDFQINIEDGIDPHIVKIPSLILQPFLENALWHGLSSKSGEKKIQVDICNSEESGFIDIIITDNGIGRAASERIKLGKVLKRNSVGIDITKDRLLNFSRDFQNSFNLEIIDLFKGDGGANGTKILLHIPTI